MIKHLPFKSLLLGLCSMVQLASYAQSGAQVQVTRNPKDNTVKTVTFNGNGPFVDNVTDAIKQYVEIGNDVTLKLKFSDTNKNGVIVQRYNTWHGNIPAEHGSVSVMIINNQVAFMNANIYKNVATNTTPVLTEAQALDKALSFINAKEYSWQNVKATEFTKNDKAFQKPAGTLVFVEDYNNDILDKRAKLAYRFDIAANEPLSRDLVYVDAQNGTILLKDAQLKHVNGTGASLYSGVVNFEVSTVGANLFELVDSNRGVVTYNMNGSTNPGSATEIQSNSTTFSKSVAIDAHWGASKVYDYWLNEHGRTSFDNSGAAVVSLINYGSNYNNAGWTGSYMIYGNGTGMFAGGFEPLVAFDVCAHELGHAICQYTANLVYARESGAMNEGFSDIWGAVIEKYAVTGKDMWTMGEELRMGALRSMANPKLFGNPDTRTGTNWTNVIGCSPNSGNDQCGVHNNSGVLNHWFYLLTDGGKGTNDLGNSFEVSGLGVKKAAQIAYATEQMLNSNDDYDICRNVSITIATTQYGACSREVEALTRAWYAVGVGTDFVPCNPQIGFEFGDTAVNKVAVSTVCPVAQVISIPMRVLGGAPTGGNATVTVAGAGNVINGADYAVVNSPITFNAGSTAAQNVMVSIYDNGDVTKDKVLKLYFTIAQNGSNATTSYTYDTCRIVIKGSRAVPDLGNDHVSQVNKGSVNSKAVSPFFSRNQKARMQFVVTAEELAAAGVRPNQAITSVQFNVTEKNSTKAFTDFTLKIDPVSAKDLAGGTLASTTVYYNGSFTTQTGWNTLPLLMTMTWNGTDDLLFETCFNNTSADANSDFVEAVVGKEIMTAVKFANSGTGCALAYTGTLSQGNYRSISKPVVRILQPTTAAEVEKTLSSSRQWDVDVNQSIYFSSTTNNKLIANISNADKKLGCTNAFIMAQGNGMVALNAPFASIKRSVKEFTVVAMNNQGSINYDLKLYFDTSELSGINLANATILATSATHDTLMDTSNTIVVAPQQAQAAGYHTFNGRFNKIYTKYFLLDNNLVVPNPPGQSVKAISRNNNIYVVNNPFTDKIYVHYNLVAATKAQVRLFDITGRVVYTSEKQLLPQQNSFEVNVSDKLLAPGNYVLQVVTGNEVMTHKMVKQ